MPPKFSAPHVGGVIVVLASCLLRAATATAAEPPNNEAASVRQAIASPVGAELENILLHQRKTGGWPKNYHRRASLNPAQREQLTLDRLRNDATIDNGATYSEIRILAKTYQASQDERLRDAALQGIDYLLESQYDNGGWPQRYPDPQGYSRHITFNDNAMIGVMTLLRDIASADEEFRFVPQATRRACGEAVDRGIACILACQIIQNGTLTVWCAQHDHRSLEPRAARSYELASLSGSESVGITRFLMQIDRPSEDIIRSVNASLDWFQRVQLKGRRVERFEALDQPRGYDTRVVPDEHAPSLWARFYDLETNKPIFCSRDGIPRTDLADISYERRNGYSWLGRYAAKLLTEDAPAWRVRIQQP